MGLISYDPLSTAGGGAFDADANTLITPSTPIVLDQATGDEAALTLDYTTNKATSGNDTGLLINQTDTLSPGASKLLDLQVGGVSKFNVDSGGNVKIRGTAEISLDTSGGSLTLGAPSGNVYLGNTSAFGASMLVGHGNVGATLRSDYHFSWSSNTTSYGPRDLFLRRDAANTLGQRNGTDAQTFNIYNAYTNATDYERAHIGWNDTADTFVIGTEAAGTGIGRGIHVEPGGSLKLKAATGNPLTLGANGSYTWQLTTGHVFGPTGNNVRDLASASLRIKRAYLGTTLDIAQGTLTDDAQALNLSSTWNDAADTFTLIKADVTDTASAAGSKLMDLQVGGASKFNVASSGATTIFGSGLVNGDLRVNRIDTRSTGYVVIGYGSGNSGTLAVKQHEMTLQSSTSLKWSSTTNLLSASDLALSRDAANTLAQRNGTDAQTFNIYNTYTNATDYERAHIGWNDTADTFVIGTEAGFAGGVNRNLRLGVGGGQSIQFYADGSQKLSVDRDSILASKPLHFYPDNTHDIGAGGLRPRNAYLGTTLDIAQGTLTDDAQALNLSSTWNDAADTFTLIKADVTDTASAAGSKLLDLQVGGASKFSVDSGGEVFGSGVNSSLRLTDSDGAELEYSNWRIGIGGSTAYFYQTTIAKVGMGVDGLRLADSGALRWSSGSQASTGHDLILSRDAAGTLGQRNGVSPQTFNIYNTYTNATNYERAHIGWNDTADTFVIGTEAGSGGGTVREIQMRIGSSSVMRLNPGSWMILGDTAFTPSASYNGVIGIGDNALDFASAAISGAIAIGSSAGRYAPSIADGSVFIGASAGYRGSSNCVSVGKWSAYGSIGGYNTTIGYESAGLSQAGTDFSKVTALGYRAAYNVSTAQGLIALGYQAGDNITSGSNNIIIGDDLDADSATADDQLNIGGIIKGVMTSGSETLSLYGNVGVAGSVLKDAQGTGYLDVSFGTSDYNSGMSVWSNTKVTMVANNVGVSTFSSSTQLGLMMKSTLPISWSNADVNGASDLRLYRDAAGTLAQRNGINAQTYNIYNTYTDASNYERGHIGWNADTFVIGTEAGSAGGTVRDMSIKAGLVSLQGAHEMLRLSDTEAATDSASKAYITYYRGANTKRIGYSGFSGINTYEISTDFAAGQFRLRTGGQVEALLVDSAGDATFAKSVSMQSQDIAQGTLTDDAQALNITSTWNDAADTFTLIKADVTDTASAAGSKLMDLQVGGTSKFSVDSGGAVSIGTGIRHEAHGGGTVARTIVGGVQRLDVGATAIGISSGASIVWNSSNYASSSGDLRLYRDAANTLGQRNGVNAQTYNIYNTYTDATNYERAHIGWNDTADTFVIGTEAGSGGGVARAIMLAP
ncbi:MAG: hypothetical protein P1U85_20800, partial [Verrucomicrobiales bacterium]|nr:hypothetical protein [Verrucomicrobiales bacterium]